MLLKVMSYISTIRKQTKPLKDSICYREKKFFKKAERLNLRHGMFLSCGIFITMPAADTVDLEQRRRGGGGGGKGGRAVLFAQPAFFLL